MGLNNLFRWRLSNKSRFTKYFKENTFGSNESVSGEGSTMTQTAIIRIKIPELIKDYNIKTFIDAPCGDFNWMRHTDLSGLKKYIGLDIVPEIINANNEKYESEKISFYIKDICKDELPSGDILLCRDCLVHLTYKDSIKAIKNLKSSGITYFLVTTFTERTSNADLDKSIWRPLNMELPPYNFPKPVYLINEQCTEDDNIYSDKSLGLYKISDIKV